MHAILLSNDLMIASRVQDVAVRQGAACQTVGSTTALLAAANLAAASVLIDLEVAPLDVVDLVKQLKSQAEPPAQIIAFGPHVKTALLARAQQAGCDAVLSRGQFDRQVGQLLSGA